MNNVRLAPFFNVNVNGIDSDGYYAVHTVTAEIRAIVAIENSDHVNNFGMVKLHDFSNIKLSDIKFSGYENESEYIEDDENEVRVVQIVQNNNVQQYYL